MLCVPTLQDLLMTKMRTGLWLSKPHWLLTQYCGRKMIIKYGFIWNWLCEFLTQRPFLADEPPANTSRTLEAKTEASTAVHLIRLLRI